MKRTTFDSDIVIDDCEYRINANRSKRQGCFVEILRKIESNLMAMLSFHCKVFVVQFVFQCHSYEERNKGVSKLMAVFKKRLSCKYKCRVTGGWVRETGKSAVQHYHVALILDGNKVKWHTEIQKVIIEILEARNYPRPSFSNHHMVFRNNPQSLQNAFYHLSYLAKTRSKSDRLPTTNDYSFGRLRPRLMTFGYDGS